MKITAITPAKGTRFRIEIDGEYWTILDAEVLADFGFQPGKEVDEATLEQALVQAERRRARERALYLLSYRDHSSGELYEKLTKSVSEQTAAFTVARMQELGFLQDGEYARKLARYLLFTKRYGMIRARQEMRRKALDDELIDTVLEELAAEGDPLEPLRELVEKKYRNRLSTPEEKKKVVAALMRLGHRYGDIRTVLDEAAEADDGYDEEGTEELWQ